MKNNNKGFTLFELVLATQIILLIAMLISWPTNLYKLIKCDFEAPYKGEIIHAIGIIPPASLVTVWFDDK